jgi:hypothetical protein
MPNSSAEKARSNRLPDPGIRDGSPESNPHQSISLLADTSGMKSRETAQHQECTRQSSVQPPMHPSL